MKNKNSPAGKRLVRQNHADTAETVEKTRRNRLERSRRCEEIRLGIRRLLSLF